MKLLPCMRPGLSQLFVGLLLVTAIISCQKELNFDKGPQKDHNLVLKFKPVVRFDSVPLVLGQEYKNFFNESFTPTAFKFYIHGIELHNTDSNRKYSVPGDQYFLVDFADSVSTEIKIPVLSFAYDRIAFTIGIDSARNVGGAQTGALDPAKGMFWNWTTGYIFAKLEGTSPASTESGNKFEFHIGGFSGADNAIRKVTLPLPFAQDIDLLPGKTTTLEITADAFDWMYNPHDIRLNRNPIITTPGLLATQVAENYTKMFTVDTVINMQ
jgi:hypothetical protein